MSAATMTATWSGRHLIAGEWTDSSAEHFQSTNPDRFDEVVGIYPRGTAHDVDAAVEAARAAFGPWRRTSRIKRGQCFGKLASLIERDNDVLARVLARESGKVLDEA